MPIEQRIHKQGETYITVVDIRDRITDIQRRLDEIELAIIAIYKRGFVGDSLSLVEMAPLAERVRLLTQGVRG